MRTIRVRDGGQFASVAVPSSRRLGSRRKFRVQEEVPTHGWWRRVVRRGCQPRAFSRRRRVDELVHATRDAQVLDSVSDCVKQPSRRDDAHFLGERADQRAPSCVSCGFAVDVRGC